MSRRRANHSAGYVADDLERLRVKLLNMGQITGRNCGQFRFYAVAVAFEILRLRSVPGPPAGAGATKSQSAADPAIGIAPGEQRVDLRRRSMRGADPELNDATNCRVEALAP